MSDTLLNKHLQMVGRLSKNPNDTISSLDIFKCSILHAAMGIAGEIGEIIYHENKENLLEEAGDMFFYIHDMKLRIPGIKEVPVIDVKLSNDFAIFAVSEIVDVVKKVCIYNSAFNEKLTERISTAISNLESWLVNYLKRNSGEEEYSKEDALTHNLNKLQDGPNARYPHGYSDKAAQERIDKQ